MSSTVVHDLLGFIYPFQTSRVLSSISSSKTSHALFPGCLKKTTTCLFLAKHPPTCLLQHKHPLIRQFPEKHHMTQLSLQRNQKFRVTDPILFPGWSSFSSLWSRIFTCLPSSLPFSFGKILAHTFHHRLLFYLFVCWCCYCF